MERGGLGRRSSKNRTKVCGWMGYAVGDLGTSSGHGEVWVRVLVWCYMECNIQEALGQEWLKFRGVPSNWSSSLIRA